MTDYERLKAKCRREASGCWSWQGGMGGKCKSTPVFHFSGTRQTRTSMAAYKAAWLLSGRTVPPGHWVYRTCTNVACVNPKHCATGTPAEMGAHHRQTGQQRGRALKRLAVHFTGIGKAVPRETVTRVVEMTDAGHLQHDIAREVGVHKSTVSLIQRGRHIHQRPMPGASVFSL